MITLLFRITAAIRPGLSPDRFTKAQSIKLLGEGQVREDDSLEIGRLFPKLSRGSILHARLVEANIRRRRVLQYTDNYHEKFKDDLRTQPNPPFADQNRDMPSLEDFPLRQGLDSDSLISRVRDDVSLSGLLKQDKSMFGDYASSSSTISTISASSSAADYRLPPFLETPEDPDNQDLRTCIACWLLLPMPDKKAWE